MRRVPIEGDATMTLAASAAELRAALGVDPTTLRVWTARGHIRKLGRDRYDVDSVKAHLATERQPTVAERRQSA
jgi:predicted site-specific integrase-resolvase